MAAALFWLAPAPLSASETALQSQLGELAANDAHVQSIGWKLISGNAQFCQNRQPAIGLLLQDMQAFSQPDILRDAYGLSGDIAVQAVATGSPAQEAGLADGAEIVALNGVKMSELPEAGPERWQRSIDLHRTIEKSLSDDGAIVVEWEQTDNVRQIAKITGIPVCASRFEVIGGSRKASANAERVAVGENFVGFTYAEDMFAAAIAHELAHVVLGHSAWLDANGRKQRNIRKTEREADRLMPWLLANAGYDPGAAVRFMELWGPDHDAGIFRSRTHDGWDERVEFIAAELPAIEQSASGTGKADWATLFTREIAP